MIELPACLGSRSPISSQVPLRAAFSVKPFCRSRAGELKTAEAMVLSNDTRGLSSSNRRRFASSTQSMDDRSRGNASSESLSSGPSTSSLAPAREGLSSSNLSYRGNRVAGESQLSRPARRQYLDEDPPGYRSRAGSVDSLPEYTEDERPLYPHDPQVNEDRVLLTTWLESEEREKLIVRILDMLVPVSPGMDIETLLRLAEVRADNWFEIEGIEKPRALARIEYADYGGDWSKWLSSVRRFNELRRRRREHEHTESDAESEFRVDLDFRIAYGCCPIGTRRTAPKTVSRDIWEAWLDSEERWGQIRMYILEGDSDYRAEDRADEDYEDLVGRRPFYLHHIHRRRPVPRPQKGSSEWERYESYILAFLAAGATLRQVEDFFDGFFINGNLFHGHLY